MFHDLSGVSSSQGRMLKKTREMMNILPTETVSSEILAVKVPQNFSSSVQVQSSRQLLQVTPKEDASVHSPVTSSQCPRKESSFNLTPHYYALLCLMPLSLLFMFLRSPRLILSLKEKKRAKNCNFSSRSTPSSSLNKQSLLSSKKTSSPSKLVSIMMPVMISMIMRSLIVSGQNCFGGIETFEKVSMTDFDENFTPAGILLQQTDQALTRDCINLCKQQSSCLSFGLDYTKFRCAAYSINSVGRRSNLIMANTTNFFEKVCYRGVSRDEYEKICGIERLWSFERVQNAFLEGFEKTQLNNVASRSECAKACLMETMFTCRSADYDDQSRICRLSKEDRRTQPQAFRIVPGSHREYIENQCAAPGESFFFLSLILRLQFVRKETGVIRVRRL